MQIMAVDCSLLCILAASIGFGPLNDTRRCSYCADSVAMDERCLALGLESAFACRQRFVVVDNAHLLYCLERVEYSLKGPASQNRRCITPDDYAGRSWQLEDAMVDQSCIAGPTVGNLFTTCDCPGASCQPPPNKPPRRRKIRRRRPSTSTARTLTGGCQFHWWIWLMVVWSRCW